MDNSRDSSIWRSLAVAFGDGLAFGVGMALSQKAGRREAPLQTETPPSGDRLEALDHRLAQLENTPARIDPKALETIVGAIESELRARDEQWSRRLESAVESAAHTARAEAGEASAAVRKEHTGLIAKLREDVVADLRALESQGLALQQEVNESLPRLIEERIAAALEIRTVEIEARLRAEIRESAAQASAAAAETVDGAIEQKLVLLREALAGRDHEIGELRESLAASDRRTLDLLSAIGQACRAAADRTALAPEPAPAEDPPPAAEPAAAEAQPAAPADNAPNFAIEMRRAWNLPLVSTLLLTGGCLACLHWL